MQNRQNMFKGLHRYHYCCRCDRYNFDSMHCSVSFDIRIKQKFKGVKTAEKIAYDELVIVV